MNKNYINTAKLIKDARLKLELTQKDISNKFNLHKQNISNIERGIAYPPDKIINKMAKMLNFSLKDYADARMLDYQEKIRNKYL